ncbi:diacylglycerol lipase-beta isoform X2 [Ptiloglossa arizonensis]|uniref:diacylglycerol lipase-beta isoform X2 n=1 Tax=Ptiloglossa arizonensis TaxID=3350558 RepID=UPI003FA14CB4
MPAIKLFGRKWLAATDDLVYPGLFEIFIRTVWLILIGSACVRYYQYTWSCQLGGELVRVYLLGQITFLAVSILFMLIIVRHSAKGCIMETCARKYVEPLLTVKILLLLPEISWNVLGSLWMFGGLTIFGLALIFDPLGSLAEKNLETLAEHSKASRVWIRRMKFFWWMRKDESANETFQHVAGLISALFRGTDLVPSDVIAGSILLRIRQKREIHELRRLNVPFRSPYTSDVSAIISDAPSWMSLENALHYIKLAIACYGWLFVLYKNICTGQLHIIQNLTCCACFRRKRTTITGDNCCYCYLAGVKVLSDLSMDDIVYASFKNHLCEIPFCVVLDHKTNSIVIIIRGSLSLRDILTDIAADSNIFECEGLPPGSAAHSGMIVGAKVILKQLNNHKILERAFNMQPTYNLVLTGHSLGAGVSVLLGFLLRPQYPNLKVYAFATPAGLVSREVAKITEEFVLTIGTGDDFVMRLSVDSTENLRISLLTSLNACRLPKYRVVLNGLGYMLFGIPERDLSKTWTNCNVITTSSGVTPLLNEREAMRAEESNKYERDITKRRFSKTKLYTGGKILHIIQCKSEEKQPIGHSKKQKTKEKKYQMRWAQPEEFTELIVMPRMLLDHLPESIERALTALLGEQNDLPYYIDP